MANNQGLGQVIQLLSTLSQMQNSRKELQLRQQQLETQQSEFARSMGFNEKSEQFKNFQKFVELATSLPTDARDKLSEAGHAAGLPDAFINMVMNVPQSLQSIKDQQTIKGLSQVPAGEVASQALTGQNLGQLGSSALIKALADAATKQVATNPELGKSFADKTAGFNALQNIVENAISKSPDLVKVLATKTAGGMTPYEAAQLVLGNRNAAVGEADVKERSLYHEMEIAKDMFVANISHGKTAQYQLQVLKLLQNEEKVSQNPKLTPAERALSRARYNRIVDDYGLDPRLRYTGDPSEPSKASLLDQFESTLNGFTGSNYTIQAPSSVGQPQMRPPQ